ncbi:DinB family protein [Nonomuraea sp. NPDC049725]|uniref:DinB family protein n=1 Tax=Nonomuraea sp. NPDC049725 TaxID=3154508 RepID=UPI00343FE195
MDLDWTAELHEQLSWHWTRQLRPRLDGLSDEEYLWEPAPGSWSIRDGVIDTAYPPPEPAPVTTIAWRLAHVIVGVLGARTAAQFGGPAVDYGTFPYATTAAGALEQLDEAYERWSSGVRSLGPRDLARPVGPSEGPYADRPLATLVLHINREVIHHGAEVALLRDLWAHR